MKSKRIVESKRTRDERSGRASYLSLSRRCQVLPSLVLSCVVFLCCCVVLCCLALSCLVVSCLALSRPVSSRLVSSRLVLSFILSCLRESCFINMPCRLRAPHRREGTTLFALSCSAAFGHPIAVKALPCLNCPVLPPSGNPHHREDTTCALQMHTLS